MQSEAFLFNYSILAISFSAVSALVMLLRQSMGGKLSNFDVYLLNVYVGRGFILALVAIFPPLMSEFELAPSTIWVASSLLGALLLAERMAVSQLQRLSVTGVKMAWPTLTAWVTSLLSVTLLLANAIIPSWRNGPIFELALVLALGAIMWAFVRRITSLIGDKPSDDWDPSRG